MTMETQITDGKINLGGNLVSRAQPKRADYVLYINANNPIAIVEAKGRISTPWREPGLQQSHDVCADARRSLRVQLERRRFPGARLPDGYRSATSPWRISRRRTSCYARFQKRAQTAARA